LALLLLLGPGSWRQPVWPAPANSEKIKKIKIKTDDLLKTFFFFFFFSFLVDGDGVTVFLLLRFHDTQYYFGFF
jgi:hypothetical protein